MLPAMPARRVPPLATALALIAAALVAATWSMRSTILDAYAGVRDGQAFAMQQTVRADLADLGGPPTAEDLARIVSDHAGDGLRYLAILDRGRVALSAGDAVGDETRRIAGVEISHVGGRVRIATRAAFRRAWGPGTRPWAIVLEVEPIAAEEAGSAATRTLGIGAFAALALLAVAVALVRGELARRSTAQQRERERRLASLGEMSAVLAHEIRNPLASLKGNAQLLATMLPEGDKPRAKADRVVEESLRLEQLTNDLLAFVRTGEITKRDTDVGALARELARDGVEVDVPDLRWSLDAERMRQVLVNLVENGVQAGGPVHVSARTAGRALRIEVRDHGPGVPAEDRERIFEPFFTKSTRGTGLGLAIAKRVVEQHGGTITVADHPQGGAVFRVEIPG
jgi:two-component system sensor histidine kinase HydH